MPSIQCVVDIRILYCVTWKGLDLILGLTIYIFGTRSGNDDQDEEDDIGVDFVTILLKLLDPKKWVLLLIIDLDNERMTMNLMTVVMTVVMMMTMVVMMMRITLWLILRQYCGSW